MESKSRVQIMNMDWPYFVLAFVILNAALYFKFLPKSLAGVLPLLIVYGAAFRYVGDRIPIVKDYLGGGSIVVLFGTSALVMFGLVPPEMAKISKDFMVGTFINFALAALCCGSIFGMDRKLLIRASVRYLPCIIGGFVVALLFGGIAGVLTGNSLSDTTLFISIPIMGGGTSAGAVPLSQMFGAIMHQDTGKLLGIMTPAVALGNAFAVIAAGLLDKLGRKYPFLTGNGAIMRDQSKMAAAEDAQTKESISDLSVFAVGITFSGIFLALGMLIQRFVPSIHAYAWMILLMVIVKILNILPENIEHYCALWFQFFIKNFTNTLLAGLGFGLISLKAVIPVLSFSYIFIVAAVVLGAIIGSAAIGWLVGFYPIEAAITAGLCMANMGGSGDIATLGACKRMVLMPFAAVSSRIGGAMVLIAGSVILSLLL
jgi:malate:Na+ symporter